MSWSESWSHRERNGAVENVPMARNWPSAANYLTVIEVGMMLSEVIDSSEVPVPVIVTETVYTGRNDGAILVRVLSSDRGGTRRDLRPVGGRGPVDLRIDRTPP